MRKLGFQDNCYFSFTGRMNWQKSGNNRQCLEGYLRWKVLLKAEFNPAVGQALVRTAAVLTHQVSLSVISW